MCAVLVCAPVVVAAAVASASAHEDGIGDRAALRGWNVDGVAVAVVAAAVFDVAAAVAAALGDCRCMGAGCWPTP